MKSNINIISSSLLGALLLGSPSIADAQTIHMRDAQWDCQIATDGHIERIVYKDKASNDTIPFFAGRGKPGPSFYVNNGTEDVVATWHPDGELTFQSTIDGINCELRYVKWHGMPAMRVTMSNHSHTPFQPVKAGLKLGVDTYMEKYPEWNHKFFPTLMRNERTHFYGYMQTPGGNVLGLVSPDAVASWSVDYNLGYQDPAPFWFMGHRIESLNIDLMNALPLPAHNPLDLWMLKDGETRTWTIAFVNVKSLDSFERTVNKQAGVPMIEMRNTACEADGKVDFVVYGSKPDVRVTGEDGKPLTLIRKSDGQRNIYSCTLPSQGLYDVTVTDQGRTSTGMLVRPKTWRWAMERAREGAWKYHQKATSHIESWYGFHSSFIAAKYFRNAPLDAKLRNRFDYLYTLLHDTVKVEPKYHKARIQNTSGTIGMLVDKYEAYGDISDLRHASRLADWLISNNQRKDGAYISYNTVYTSVIYVAKSILELSLVENRLGANDPFWASKAKEHYASAKRAIDQLVGSDGDFQTEGELTFEDGMISCSALQIGMLGLMQSDATARKHYTDAMLKVLNSHDCLAQLRVPDARRRGGTMRYWEAQYDVQMLPNMFNSPHGWSAWRAYATYYAYLLTGNERWLRESYNAASAFSCMADYKTGDLRWAFVVDPYLKVTQACSPDTHVTEDSLSFGNPHPMLYQTRKFTIGEQYVNMISDWQTVNTQDNDVHELFKFIGESMLTNAFVVEREDGRLYGYNCFVKKQGDKWVVEPLEKQMNNLHCNLRHARKITFRGETKTLGKGYLGWAFGHNEYKFQ